MIELCCEHDKNNEKNDMIRMIIRDMIKTYSQMHRTDKYSQHSSIIWPVWPNG